MSRRSPADRLDANRRRRVSWKRRYGKRAAHAGSRARPRPAANRALAVLFVQKFLMAVRRASQRPSLASFVCRGREPTVRPSSSCCMVQEGVSCYVTDWKQAVVNSLCRRFVRSSPRRRTGFQDAEAEQDEFCGILLNDCPY
jgi:hypothetical protein